jgi:hypothetical protein
MGIQFPCEAFEKHWEIFTSHKSRPLLRKVIDVDDMIILIKFVFNRFNDIRKVTKDFNENLHI